MSSNSVEQIKERLSIADVVGSYVKLEKAGANMRARCPFHSEKTPSFFVSPARESYHCFGCDRGGDIFSFVQEVEGVDFKGALVMLAERAGVTLEYSGHTDDHSEKERLHTLLETATIHFQINLTKNTGALSYLYGRGVKGETLKKFRVGFAADSFNELYNTLKGKGFSDAEMEKAGLIVRSERGPYDRFRSRIMFPIADPAGRIVAFSGRIFGKEDDKQGKYVNSPETILFHKSHILYGYDKAKMEIRKKNVVVFVEGQMDLLLAHQAGTENAVAVSGTALTEWHIGAVRRLAERAIFSFDGDKAGLAAAERAAKIALLLGMDARAVPMPDGLDPADFIVKDADAWRARVEDAKPVITFLLELLKNQFPDTRSFRLEAGKRVLPLIAVMENKIDQAHFLKEVSATIGISEEALREEMGKIFVTAPPVLVRDEKEVAHTRKKRPVTREHILISQIVSVIFWQEGMKEPMMNIGAVRKRLAELLGEEQMKIWMDISEDEKRERIFEAEAYFEEAKDLEAEVLESLNDLEKEILKRKMEEASRGLKDAEVAGESDRVKEFLTICQDLAKKIGALVFKG